MRLTAIAKLVLAMALLTTRALPQTLQISRVEANPTELSCSGGPVESTLTVQVFFDKGVAGLKNREIEISISGWRGLPPSNKLRIVDQAKNVTLEVSPAMATFRVACGPETVPGEVELFADIDNPPPNLKIDRKIGSPGSRVIIKIKGK